MPLPLLDNYVLAERLGNLDADAQIRRVGRLDNRHYAALRDPSRCRQCSI